MEDKDIHGDVAWRTGAPAPFAGGRLEVEDSAGARRVIEQTSLMGWLDQRLTARRCARGEKVKSWQGGHSQQALDRRVQNYRVLTSV